MLMGDERDGVGDSDLPDEQDFELVECIYAKTEGQEYCVPFDNVIHMYYDGENIEFSTNAVSLAKYSNASCNVNDIWQSWLVHCGAKPKPVAEF